MPLVFNQILLLVLNMFKVLKLRDLMEWKAIVSLIPIENYLQEIVSFRFLSTKAVSYTGWGAGI